MIWKIVLVLILFVLPLVPTFWAIQDVPKRQFRSPRRKLLWFMSVSIFPFVGAVVYILFERKKTESINVFMPVPRTIDLREKVRS